MTKALTHTSWINAWSLRRACRDLGVDLRVAAGPRDLPLPQIPPHVQPQWQFFTEEASLRRALESGLPGFFLPEHFPAALLDDKLAFADCLAADPDGPRALAHWSLADAALARYPLLLKSRHSWVDGRKLPRGWVCRDVNELQGRLAQLEATQMRPAWFFLQEWLGDEPMRLLSVAGFFDADNEARTLTVVTERVADYGDSGPSSSAMLVTVDDDCGLIPATLRVLRGLGYRGPFEMEFIVNGAKACLLELNPRFWMQHGLFSVSGNGLVKRYIGRDTAADHAEPKPLPRLLWVDGTWLLRRMLRLDRRVIGTWWRWRSRGYRTLCCPSLAFSLWAGLWRMLGGGRE